MDHLDFMPWDDANIDAEAMIAQDMDLFGPNDASDNGDKNRWSAVLPSSGSMSERTSPQGAAAHHGFRVPKEPASLRRQTALDICHQEYLQLPTVLQECGLLDDNTNDLESYDAPRLAKATEELILQVVVSRKDPEDFRVIGRLAWMLLNELNGSLSIERRNHCVHSIVGTCNDTSRHTARMLMEDAKSDGVATFKSPCCPCFRQRAWRGRVAVVLPQRGKCLQPHGAQEHGV
ncbi:hypothetical protein H257_13117 [Aphanomyces astaci]|uniref:Uncharacterized protein n=1 Tax=Aphanomyces astaci TaxID=112090 RepID=W4FY25_APHAT|nr:hypothetical protein H257_13117 [Aphanomyces astaci]ETV71684.1 hypothetical protein H257_13117 [Aphanomyces astaci]|eukprot:XP_009838872.1 hypothetical protein H257_13117 [Aphanomyces astaci]